MDEKYISDLYNQLGGKSVFGEYADFKSLINTDDSYASDVYNQMGGESVFGKYDDFRSLTKGGGSPLLKKKEDTTALPLEVGSSVSSVSTEPEMAQFGYQPGKPLPEQIPSVQPDQPAQPKYTEEVMFGPMGISGVKTTGKAPEFEGKSIPKVIGEIGKVIAKGVVKFPSDTLETAAIVTAAAKNLAAKTGLVDETSAFNVSLPFGGVNVNFFQAAREWENLVNDFIPTDKDIESGFWGQTANALGQMVPILLTGGLSGGAKAIAKEAGKKGLSMQAVANYGKNVVSRIGTPQGAITISQVAAPSYEQAKLEGATENEAQAYALQNAVMTFPLEMLPVNNLFKRLDNVLVGNKGVEVLKRAVIGGGEELITEGAQAVYENVTADAIYGATRGFLDGVGEAAAVGGTVGAIMNGVLTALLGRRARATSDKEIEEIDKSIKDVEQKIAQVDSNNESLKETVKVLEESKLRKLSYGSADYNFIESPEGDLEYADDALTEEQAQGIIGNLANSYKKIDFKIEEVEPEDPYQPTTYKIIGTPKTTQQDAIQEQAAGQVPVQSGATVSQEVAQGEPKAEPQITPEKIVQKEIIPEVITEEVVTPEVITEEALPESLADIDFDEEGDLTDEGFTKAQTSLKSIVEQEANNAGIPVDILLKHYNINSRGEYLSSTTPILRVSESNNYQRVIKTLKDISFKMFPDKIDELNELINNYSQEFLDAYGRGDKGVVLDKSHGKLLSALDNINNRFNQFIEPKATTEAVVQEEVVSSKTPKVKPTAQPQAQPAAAPIAITDILNDIKVSFAPETAVEVQKGTREDTRGKKLTYDAAVTAQATDKNGTPIGLMTKRSDGEGKLSFTVKDANGRNINKGKAYPTEGAARTALAEQVNRVRAKATPAPVAPVAVAPTSVVAPAPVVAPEPEPIVIEEEEGPELVTAKEIKSNTPTFTKDNSIDYEEDYKEDSMGREVPYISSLTVEALDINGESIGTITRLVDEDKNTTYTAQDSDGRDIGGGQEYSNLQFVTEALAKQVNKQRQKAFDKEKAREAKQREKAAAKVKLAEERKAAKQAAKEKTPEVDAVIEEDANAEGVLERSLDFLDNASKSLGKRLKTNANDALLGIPLSTLKLAIDAARVLVRAGVALRDAIAKVANDYNLAAKDVEEALRVVAEEADKEAAAAMPMSADNVLYSDSDILPKPEKKASNSSVAKLLQEVAANFWGGSIVTSETITPEQERLITNNGTEETIRAFESSGKNAADWYSKAIETAIAVAGVIHPELSSVEAASKIEAFAKEKDPVKAAQMALRMALAITSQNLNVDANTTYAEEQFNYFIKNGKFDPSKEYGAKAPAISSNLKLANLLIDKLGLNGAENFVSQDFTVNQLEEAFQKATGKKVKISGLRNDDVNGAAIFGPKIGQGFLQNLMGKFDPVTIDLWMRRTWGRWTGDVVGTGITDERMATLIQAVNNGVKNKEIPKSLIPKEFFQYKPIQEKRDKGNLYWTMNDKFNERIENDLEFVDVLNKFTKELTRQANNLYKAVHDIPMSKELYDKFLSGELSYFQTANKLLAIRESMGEKYTQYAAKERANKTKPLNKAEWIASQDEKAKRTFSPTNKELSERKPKWGNAAKNIVVDLNPIDIPSNLDRRVITRVVNNIRKNVNARGYNVTNADVQALLWYPEKDIWAKLRGEEESILKLSYDDQFIKIAKERGLGKQAEAVAEDIRGRRTESDVRKDDRRTDGKVSSRVDELAEIDVKTPSNAESVINFLDGVDKSIAKLLKTQANDALLAIPLTAVRGMIQGIKALVETGVKLRDAINKIAADNNITKEKLKDILELASISNEFNALMTKADEMITRQKSRNIPEKKIVLNLDKMVRDFYKDMNVNDAQRKIMEREARARMGAEPRKAASIGRVLGVLKDIANVTREEKLKIISRIRELGRDVAKDLAAEIRAMSNGGTITTKQAGDIIARFGKVNMLNEISVSNFVDYMSRVFANAEYVAQLETAKSARKKLRSLSKDKNKSANLRDLAAKFVEIDPTMVEDIAAYNEVAKKIKESVEGSSIKGKDVKFADIVKEGIVTPYIDETLKAQNDKLYQERLKEAKDILGIDAKDLSYDELLVLLSKGKEKEKKQIRFSFENLDTNELMNSIINAFDVYSSILESSIRTGVDPFTGEKVTYTESQKKLISEFIKMDLNILPQDQALEAVDSLLNFIQNNSTAKMESIFKGYMGEKNIRGLVKKGVRASALRKYFSTGLARFFGEQTTNLGLLFERLFKGFEAGGEVQDAMGLTDLINGKSQAQNESNRIINDYVNEFYKKKANNEAFNTELNNVERGMAAWMMRNIIGTDAEMKKEFKRRKDLILGIDENGKPIGSIVELENGNEKEQAKAKLYQEVYDKILKDANSIDDVIAKVDAVNLEAVKFWQTQWQSKYDELSDVSVNVYNKILEKDINYTPDKYARLSTNTEAVEITENDMAFNVNNGTLYDKESGPLMKANKPYPLPADRFIDLSFDSNNANSMYDALVDIKTAGPIRQVQAFLNSKSFKKVFPKAEDAVILKGSKKDKRIGRIELFTRNFRNKNPYSEDEFSAAVRNLNRLANVGVSQALGGIFQPVKQVIPAAMNTLINGGGLDFNAMTNPDKIKFMMDSGYAIGFRGVESQAQVDSLNKLMDMAAKSRGEKAMKYIEEANKIWLKVFLVKPDVFIARASWMTYYEQSLGKQGIDSKGIDYKTHKLNEKAANYAQRMLDRQQNVSDADLSGKLFSEKNPSKQVMMKVFMPFASFRMNQSARLGADIATVTSKVSTEEDRKIAARSLAGFAVEMATFRALSLGISLLTTSLVASMMGSDEEDEEKRKNSIIKGQATNTVSDVLSPIPFTDPIIQAVAATTLQAAQDVAGVDEEDMVSLYSPQEKGYLEQIGLFGFAAQRVAQTGELVWMSSVGSYRDSYGKKKYVSDDDKDALRLLIGPAILTNVGLAPSEMNSVIRASMSAAKKNSSTKEGGSTSGKDYESQMLDIMEEDLLEGYENKTELKRYNPRLFEQNFGERSEYYQLTKEKRAEQKKLDEEEQKEKDAEYGYKGDSKGFGSRSKSSGKGFGSKGFGKD